MNHSIKYVLGVLLIGLAGFVVGCEIDASRGLGCPCTSNEECSVGYCDGSSCTLGGAECTDHDDCECGKCLVTLSGIPKCHWTCDHSGHCNEGEVCKTDGLYSLSEPELVYGYCEDPFSFDTSQVNTSGNETSGQNQLSTTYAPPTTANSTTTVCESTTEQCMNFKTCLGGLTADSFGGCISGSANAGCSALDKVANWLETCLSYCGDDHCSGCSTTVWSSICPSAWGMINCCRFPPGFSGDTSGPWGLTSHSARITLCKTCAFDICGADPCEF